MARLQEQAVSYGMQEVLRRASEDSRKLREVEDRLEILENRLITIERSTLEKGQQFHERIEHIEADLKNMIRIVDDLSTTIDRFNRNVERLATKTELKQVEKMAELLLDVQKNEA